MIRISQYGYLFYSLRAMKNIKFVLLILFSLNGIFGNVKAQVFNCFDESLIYYYNNLSFPKQFVCVYSDTTFSNESDTTYQLRRIPNASIPGVFDECIPMIPTFMGPNLIKMSREIIFFNKWNDSLRFNLNESLGLVSLVHQNDSLKISIFSTYLGRFQDTIMGIPDSLYCFGFKVVNEKGDTLSNHLIAKQQICFSAKWGLVKSIPWDEFPYFNSSIDIHLLTGVLAKDGSLKVGLVNKYKEHTFEYEVGDEFHTHYSQCGWYQWGISQECTIEFVRTKILAKTIQSDIVSYKQAVSKVRTYSISYVNSPEKNYTSSEESNQTIFLTVSYNKNEYPYSLKDLYPLLPGNDFENFTQTDICGKYMFPGKAYLLQSNSIYHVSDTCWKRYPSSREWLEEFYIDGIGGPFFHRSSSSGGNGSTSNSLVYYKSGSGSCVYGIPLGLFNSIEVEKPRIFPNPATKSFQIVLPSSRQVLQLQLYSMDGTLLISRMIGNEEEVDLISFPPGLYLIKLLDSFDNRVFHSRLIVN